MRTSLGGSRRRGFPEGAMSNGVYALPSAAKGKVKPVVSSTPLVDFLMQLEDYTPTIPDAVTDYYLNRAINLSKQLSSYLLGNWTGELDAVRKQQG